MGQNSAEREIRPPETIDEPFLDVGQNSESNYDWRKDASKDDPSERLKKQAERKTEIPHPQPDIFSPITIFG